MEVCLKRFPRCGSSIFRLVRRSSRLLGKPFWPPPAALRRKTQATKSSAITGSRRSEEHTSELQSQSNLVCRLLLEKKKKKTAHLPLARRHGVRTSRRRDD